MLGVQMQLHIYVYGIFYHVTIISKVRFIIILNIFCKTITFISIFRSTLFYLHFIHIVREMRTESKEKTQIFKRGLNRYEIGQAYH